MSNSPHVDIIGNIISQIINPTISLLVAIAFILFLVGVVQFLWGSGEEKTRASGKSNMKWGIIGLSLMLVVFGIMNLISGTIADLMK